MINRPTSNPLSYKCASSQIHVLCRIGAALHLALAQSGSTQTPSSDPTIPYVITLVASADLGIILLLRRFMLDRALSALQQNPTDPAALLRWRTAMILTSAGVYSCFLFDWVLAFLRTTHTWTYRLLWFIAFIGFFIFAPRMPADEMTTMPNNTPPGQ